MCVPSALKVTEVPCPPSTKSPVWGVLPAGVVARWQVLGAGPDDLERPVLALAWSAADATCGGAAGPGPGPADASGRPAAPAL